MLGDGLAGFTVGFALDAGFATGVEGLATGDGLGVGAGVGLAALRCSASTSGVALALAGEEETTPVGLGGGMMMVVGWAPPMVMVYVCGKNQW